jgi:hypothetical protein
VLRIASAEIRYNFPSFLVWFSVLLVGALWPLLEQDGSSFRMVSTLLITFVPLAALSVAIRMLGAEGSEGHLRLFRTLPLTNAQVAAARLLRLAVTPLLALLLALAFAGAGYLSAGPDRQFPPETAWLLGTWFFAGLGVLIAFALLHDVGGMLFAQVSGVLLVAALILGVRTPLVAPVLPALTSFVSAPAGMVAAAALCALLVAGNIAVFSRRQR